MTQRRRGEPAIALAIILISSCAWFKDAARTANDAARVVCELWATDNHVEARLKLTPADFCAVHDNLQPFLDAVLAAKQTAGAEVGDKHGLSNPPDL